MKHYTFHTRHPKVYRRLVFSYATKQGHVCLKEEATLRNINGISWVAGNYIHFLTFRRDNTPER